jgi:hypothetical protein
VGHAFVGHVVEVTTGFDVGIVEVDGGRNPLIANGQNRQNGFDTTGRTNTVPCHALGRTDLELVSMIAKYGFDGLGFGGIVDLGRGCLLYTSDAADDM